jgi:hypothetical protein
MPITFQCPPVADRMVRPIMGPPGSPIEQAWVQSSQRFRFSISVLCDSIASPLSTLPGLAPNPAHNIGALLRPPLSATRHPRYWSRSEISDGSRRSIRGELADASCPTRRFHGEESTARRAKRDVELFLLRLQNSGSVGKSQRAVGSPAER